MKDDTGARSSGAPLQNLATDSAPPLTETSEVDAQHDASERKVRNLQLKLLFNNLIIKLWKSSGLS